MGGEFVVSEIWINVNDLHKDRRKGSEIDQQSDYRPEDDLRN